MNTNDRDERILDAVRAAGQQTRLSDEARGRIERTLRGDATGATTLRSVERTWPRRTIWALAAAAAAIVGGLWVFPAIDRQTTISAAEVLGRSQQALAAPLSGVQVITYDLTVGGVLEDLLPAGQAGAFTVEETVDYDHPGRYRVVKLAPDGQVMAGVADDPLARTRARYVRLDNRGFLLRFTATPASALSAISLKRTALQALIGMMQGSANKLLREVDRGGEPAYEVDVPTIAGDAGLIALQRGRVVVGRSDARLLDFEAQGTIGGQPFAITFNLRSREARPSDAMPADAFTIEPARGDEVIEAQGTSPAPLWDVVRQCLRR